MRNDLDEEIRLAEFAQDGSWIQLLVLITHAAHGAEHRAEMQRADKRLALMAKFWPRQFLRKLQISRPPAIGASSSRYIE